MIDQIVRRILIEDDRRKKCSIPESAIQRFYSSLGLLLEAGVDISSALLIIQSDETNPKRKGSFKAILEKVKAGFNLSAALEHSIVIHPQDSAIIRSGEETGHLSKVLLSLGKQKERLLKQKREFIAAVSYPSFILLTVVGVLSFMMTWMVPMFQDSFKRLDGELPLLTKMVIGFSEIARATFLPVLVIAVLLLIALKFLMLNEEIRGKMQRIVLKIPIVGQTLFEDQLIRMLTVLETTLTSKVPLYTCLELSSQAVSYIPVAEAIRETKDAVLSGRSLHAALRRTGIFPERMVIMVRVCEEINQLEKAFATLADQFRAKQEFRNQLMKTILEPALILTVGVIVGVVVISMYLPIFEMGGSPS